MPVLYNHVLLAAKHKGGNTRTTSRPLRDEKFFIFPYLKENDLKIPYMRT